MKFQGKTNPTRRPKGFIKRSLRPADFDGSLDGMIIKDVAVILNRGYHETLYAIRKYGLRSRFPARGGEATQIGKRGYDYISNRKGKQIKMEGEDEREM